MNMSLPHTYNTRSAGDVENQGQGDERDEVGPNDSISQCSSKLSQQSTVSGVRSKACIEIIERLEEYDMRIPKEIKPQMDSLKIESDKARVEMTKDKILLALKERYDHEVMNEKEKRLVLRERQEEDILGNKEKTLKDILKVSTIVDSKNNSFMKKKLDPPADSVVQGKKGNFTRADPSYTLSRAVVGDDGDQAESEGRDPGRSGHDSRGARQLNQNSKPEGQSSFLLPGEDRPTGVLEHEEVHKNSDRVGRLAKNTKSSPLGSYGAKGGHYWPNDHGIANKSEHVSDWVRRGGQNPGKSRMIDLDVDWHEGDSGGDRKVRGSPGGQADARQAGRARLPHGRNARAGLIDYDWPYHINELPENVEAVQGVIRELPKSLIFDGKSMAFDVFESRLALYVRNQRGIFTGAQMRYLISTGLSAGAAEFFHARFDSARFTTRQIMEGLRRQFGNKELPLVAKLQLKNLHQFESESDDEWSTRVYTKVSQALPGRGSADLEEEMISSFCTGLHDKGAAEFILQQEPVTLVQAQDLCKVFRASKEATRGRERTPKVFRVEDSCEKEEKVLGFPKEVLEMFQEMNRSVKSMAASLRVRSASRESRNRSRSSDRSWCRRCGDQGHTRDECSYKTDVCSLCKSPDHFRADCPTKKAGERDPKA